MKEFLIPWLLFFVPYFNFSYSADFKGYEYFNNAPASKNIIIERINMETKFIISEIEYQIYLKENKFKTVN